MTSQLRLFQNLSGYEDDVIQEPITFYGPNIYITELLEFLKQQNETIEALIFLIPSICRIKMFIWREDIKEDNLSQNNSHYELFQSIKELVSNLDKRFNTLLERYYSNLIRSTKTFGISIFSTISINYQIFLYELEKYANGEKKLDSINRYHCAIFNLFKKRQEDLSNTIVFMQMHITSQDEKLQIMDGYVEKVLDGVINEINGIYLNNQKLNIINDDIESFEKKSRIPRSNYEYETILSIPKDLLDNMITDDEKKIYANEHYEMLDILESADLESYKKVNDTIEIIKNLQSTLTHHVNMQNNTVSIILSDTLNIWENVDQGHDHLLKASERNENLYRFGSIIIGIMFLYLFFVEFFL